MGYRLVDWLGVGDTETTGDAEGDADGLTGGLADGLAVAVAVVGAVVGTAVVEAELVTVGENEGTVGVVVDEPAEQAERAAEANMVMAPQPTAVSRTLSAVPAMVGRTFIGPPHGSGRRRMYFPIAAAQTGRPRRENVQLAPSRPGPGGDGPPKGPTDQKGKTPGRPRRAMACSALEY